MSDRYCEKIIYGGNAAFGGSRCSNKAKVEVNGKWFCGTHSPEAEARRKAKRDQRYEEFVAASNRRAVTAKYHDACIRTFHSPTRTIATEQITEGLFWRMHDALEALAKDCPDCGGEGTVYLLMDETEIGQAPGSSGRDCNRCAEARALLSSLKIEE